ncbi:L-fucose mutarotase [Lipingzhangella halophila]|uniref:L-fucose mutarotase n=1 Tax=Lipingzhangella halophila TaxID=1783352 RepID=A0A7W7RIS2_9ACTN|nr:RbsD/FucU domain-containing protein [Lipingzhangella halophila]MBB4932318.1 L-fucose mutarotase [Lipingzhangella halophila]
MITYRLLHPEILAGLAAAGHGAQVLIADALYPHSTGVPAPAARVHLNLRPGLVAARDVLEVVADTVHIEAAVYMADADGGESEPVREYRGLLGSHRHGGDQEVAWSGLERTDFYAACRRPDVCMLVATGETRPYANLLLRIGVP